MPGRGDIMNGEAVAANNRKSSATLKGLTSGNATGSASPRKVPPAPGPASDPATKVAP